MHASTSLIMDRSIHSKMPGTFKLFLWIGEDRAVQTPDMEKHVLDHVDWDAGVSTWQMEEELDVPQMAIWKVLHEQLLYPYH
jgi:hypothetical protein